MNTSPSLSPPGSDLDGLVARIETYATALRELGSSARALIRTYGSPPDGVSYNGLLIADLSTAAECLKLANGKLEALEAELKRRDEALREVVAVRKVGSFTSWQAAEMERIARAALQPQEGGDA